MFNELKKSITKVKVQAVFSIVFMTLECLFEIFIPFFMSKLIDNGIEINNFSNVKAYGMLIMLLVFGEIISGCACASFAIYASTVFAVDLRERVFTKLQTFGFSNIDKFSTGSLVTRTTQDIAYAQRAFQMLIRMAIRSVGMLVFSLVLSYKINLKIAIAFTLIMPVITSAFIILAKLAMPVFEKMFSAFDELNNIISENIHGIRVVKSFNREDHEYDKMKGAADNIFRYSVKAEKYIALWDPFMNVSIYAVIICIAWLGSKAIIASGNNPALGLTTGKLMSLMTYGMQMLLSLMMISMIYVMLIITSASLKRINEVLVEEVKVKNGENPITTVNDGSIEFKNVSFKYKADGKKNVLKNVNISIKSGESIGIIGGTGSCKSTLVNLIPRLYDVTEGEVLVSGVNVKDYDLTTLRKAVGIVLQKNVLFSGTIASNLRFGNEKATIAEMEEACDIAGAMEFINNKPDRFETVVEQGGNNFSGGQKQRLSIARTILKKPKIIIFDDSTSAVDTKTDAKIREGLKNGLPNTTKITISQRIISLLDCDKIIVMEKGDTIDFDTHENLIKNCDIYRDIYKLQMEK